MLRQQIIRLFKGIFQIIENLNNAVINSMIFSPRNEWYLPINFIGNYDFSIISFFLTKG